MFSMFYLKNKVYISKRLLLQQKAYYGLFKCTVKIQWDGVIPDNQHYNDVIETTAYVTTYVSKVNKLSYRSILWFSRIVKDHVLSYK